MFFAFIKGIRKGFIQSLFSFVAFFIGLAAAIKLSAFAGNYLSLHTQISGKWVPFISFVLVFAIIVISINYIGKMFEKTAEMVLMGWLNKFGGVCLFLILYGMIFSVILFYGTEMKFISRATINSSVFYSYISPLAPGIINGLGKVIPIFKDLFKQLEHYFEGVYNKI